MEEKIINGQAEEVTSEEKLNVFQKVGRGVGTAMANHGKAIRRVAIASAAGIAGLAFANWAIKHASDDYDFDDDFDDSDLYDDDEAAEFEELLKETEEAEDVKETETKS